MKKLFLISVAAVVVSLSSCNYTARKFGGTQNIELEKNEKLVNITFKDNDLWVLVSDSTKPKTYTFKEYSNLGILQGKVVITEK